MQPRLKLVDLLVDHLALLQLLQPAAQPRDLLPQPRDRFVQLMPQLLGALGYYCLAVLIGLAIQVLVTYPVLLRIFTPLRVSQFMHGVVQAQLVAFSTSSSAATLPVTMKTAQRNLGVSEEVASFVLPLGATINMDGTGLYQAVAAVFIAQTLASRWICRPNLPSSSSRCLLRSAPRRCPVPGW